MWWVMQNLALAAAVAAGTPPPPAQSQAHSLTAEHLTPVLTTNATILASLKRISAGSPLWREAMKAVRETGRHVLVVTPSDVVTSNSARRSLFADDDLAEAVPVLGGGSRITAVVVVVNLRLLQGVHDTRLSVRRDFEADLDRILVHEVYGHAVPYLIAGDLSARCADPERGENASQACSIRRENAVRAELGLGSRSDRGLSSLTLASHLR